MHRLTSILYIVFASGVHAQAPTIPELLPQDKEMAIALNAAPEHLRSGASVYVLKRERFRVWHGEEPTGV